MPIVSKIEKRRLEPEAWRFPLVVKAKDGSSVVLAIGDGDGESCFSGVCVSGRNMGEHLDKWRRDAFQPLSVGEQIIIENR